MNYPKTLREAILYFAEYDNCRSFLIGLRWPDGKVRCPHCNSDHVAYLESAKLYKCYGKHPKAKFSLKVGTIFEDSPLGLEKWLPAMWLVVNAKNGISSCEIARALGITQKSAWHMAHRIRFALRHGSFDSMLCGEVEADETYIGGKLKNMHKSKRPAEASKKRGAVGKAIVVGMLERRGRVRAEVVFERTTKVLHQLANENLAPGTTLITDEWGGYKGTDFEHQIINHAIEYVNGHIHTNGIENFWSLLKRGINGTYVSVEPFHLSRYLDEQIFRYENRATPDNPLNDLDRFTLACSQIIGKRLTWDSLTGKEMDGRTRVN